MRRADHSFRGVLPGMCVSNFCDLDTATIWRPRPDFGPLRDKQKLRTAVDSALNYGGVCVSGREVEHCDSCVLQLPSENCVG